MKLLNNSTDKDLFINLVLQYFKVDNNFFHSFKGPADLQTFTVFGKHSMLISENNKPLSEILSQIFVNNTQQIFQEYEPYHHEPSSFAIICNQKRIGFIMNKHSEALEQVFPFRKGRTLKLPGDPIIYIDTPNLCGILSLVATR
jgi:hypothetical protein